MFDKKNKGVVCYRDQIDAKREEIVHFVIKPEGVYIGKSVRKSTEFIPMHRVIRVFIHGN